MSGDTSDECVLFTSAPQQIRTEQLEAVVEQLRELPLRNLPEDEEDAELARLRAERRELRALLAEESDEPVQQVVRETG